MDWGQLESELGTALPADYKLLADTYPSLKFDDFLGWFSPASPSDPAIVAQEMMDVLQPLRTRLEGQEDIDVVFSAGNRSTLPPYPVYPQPQGVLQWGMTENGDRCLWLTRGDPDEWTVVVERGMWWHFQGGMAEFLVEIMTRRVRCPLFPEDFPDTLDVEQSLD
ncbi:hypothetical protein [Actinomadura sp. 7K534]|uniref:hypothetical protein n=1 Tax=Actinomadura sp. 7K534 TaxID=2530366 RepID=UPI001050B0E9|nr:hypothetical protein [Actinomadura sp. 7K534]TDB90078.1 hypothetical protein E1266_28720 [Actinomadura sp. 7K534]